MSRGVPWELSIGPSRGKAEMLYHSDIMSNAVVYRSFYGNRRFAAEQPAEKLSVEVVELVEDHGPRKGFGVFGLLHNAISNNQFRPAGDPWRHVRAAEEIRLISPKGASSTALAANAFLKSAHLGGKTVGIAILPTDLDREAGDRDHGQLRQPGNKAGARLIPIGDLHFDRPSLEPQVESLIRDETA